MLNLPANIKERIEQCVAGQADAAKTIDEEARSHGAIALMGTIGVIWGLRPDGTFWQFDEDFGLELAPLPTELELEAIVWGTYRHPWLKELLPGRPATATTCPFCNGQARISPVFLCPTCRGLGWVA